MADDKDKLNGQRTAIREHIDKYHRYDDYGKRTALATIKNAQAQIRKIIKKHSHWPSSWEDGWTP